MSRWVICHQKYMQEHNGNAENYYWPLDGHHNPKGYEMMGNGAFEALKSYSLLPKDSILD